jgi:hypothetical protein
MIFGKERRDERRRPQVEINLLDDDARNGGLLATARRAWRLPALGAGLVMVALLVLRLGGHL